jgi:hypothetical protein
LNGAISNQKTTGRYLLTANACGAGFEFNNIVPFLSQDLCNKRIDTDFFQLYASG